MKIGELTSSLPQDALGTLKPWSQYLTRVLLEDNIVMPPEDFDREAEGIVGGYVADPVIGKHKNLLSADISSAYPLLGMVGHNMSPETFIPINRRPQELQDHLNKYYYDQDEARILGYDEQLQQETTKLLKKHNVTLGMNGAVFTKDFEGVIPKVVKGIYKDRKAAKKQMFVHDQKAVDLKQKIKESGIDIDKLQDQLEKELHLMGLSDTFQMTLKILMNSLFGALAMKYFVLFNESFAGAITMNSRFFVRFMSQRINEKMFELTGVDCGIYNDTDSFYFTIEPLVNKHCKGMTIDQITEWSDRFYQKVIEPVVQKSIDDFAQMTNAYDKSVIGADREAVCDVGIFVAKKKYALRVRDNEGTRYPVDDPYMKVMGLDIKQGGIAKFSKTELQSALDMFLDKEEKEIKTWLESIREKYKNAQMVDVAKTIGVTKVEDPNWGKIINGRKVSVPFGSRACVVSNNYIKENNLGGQFPMITPGSKVKIWYLNEPNPLKSSVFASDDPRFAKLFEEYIDKDTNFQKFFMGPLEGMTKAIGIDFTHNTEEIDIW
jgi:DNA polymerase elongation subunit (family B)